MPTGHPGFRHSGTDAADSVLRPGVGELRQKAGEVGAFGLGEGLQGGAHGIPPPTPEAGDETFALGGDPHTRAPGVVGVGLALHQPHLHALLHEARRAGLIDADRVGDLAHGQGAGCRDERVEHPQARDAGEPSLTGIAPWGTAVERMPTVMFVAVRTAVTPARTEGRARTPTAELGEGGGDLVGGVGGHGTDFTCLLTSIRNTCHSTSVVT